MPPKIGPGLEIFLENLVMNQLDRGQLYKATASGFIPKTFLEIKW
jgi:hypothetical protein